MKAEQLIKNEYYYAEYDNLIFKHNGIVDNQEMGYEYKVQLYNRKKYFQKNSNLGIGGKIEKTLRLATEIEKAWLNHCIKKDKFVDYDEFIKVYKPEFIVGQWYRYNNHIGKFYSYNNDIFQVSEYIHNKKYYNSNSNWGDRDQDTKRSLATIEEIQEFLPKGHPDKQLDIKQIQEECKRRFPIGCTFKNPCNNQNYTIEENDIDTYKIIENQYIDGGESKGYLYYKDKYAELIETPEVIVPEYVEYIDTKYKGKIVKIEDWKCGSYCKVLFADGKKEQPFKHLVKPSTKEAYEAQNFKIKSEDTEIKVGDYIQYEDKNFYTVESNNPVNLFHHSDNTGNNNYCKDLTILNSLKKFKIVKKSSNNTKKVDFSSLKVTNTLYIKPRNQTTVVTTEERRTRLKLNYSKTIKTKQHVN